MNGPDVIILIRQKRGIWEPPGTGGCRVASLLLSSAWLKTHGIAKGGLQCWQTSWLMCRPKYLWWLFMVRTYISTFIPLPGCRLTVLSGPEKETFSFSSSSSFPSSRFSLANRFLKYYCCDPGRTPGPTLILRSLEINRAPFESASMMPAALNYFRLINKSRSTVCNNRNDAFRKLTGINRREGREMITRRSNLSCQVHRASY